MGADRVPRVPFAHVAVVNMGEDADDRAPGAAITVALCGSRSHEPPCPLAAHHTAAERSGADVRLRVLFAASPDDEGRVRSMIHDALAAGGRSEDGGQVAWRLRSDGAAAVRPEEQDHAERLTRS